MVPDVLGNVRIVALGDRPRARRIHDARALAGDDPAIVAGVVPGVNVRRVHRHELLHVLERLAGLVGVDLDLVVMVDEHDAHGFEERADPVDRVRRLAHRQADREAGLVQLLRALEIEIPRPEVGLLLVVLRLVVREHVAQVDAGMLLVEVEARLAGLHLAAHRGRNASPAALDLRQIFGDRADRAELLDHRVDDVVERLELVAMDTDVPVAVGHDVVAGAGLGFRGRSQLVLLTLRGDVVDMDFDLVLVAPFLGDLVEGLVGARNPVVPASHRDRAGGVGAADIWRRDCGSGTESGGFQNGSARDTARWHINSSQYCHFRSWR